MREGNYSARAVGEIWFATWFHDGHWRDSDDAFDTLEGALEAARNAALSHSWVVQAFGGEVEIKELPAFELPSLPPPPEVHWWSSSDLILGWEFPSEFGQLMGVLHRAAAARPDLQHVKGFVTDEERRRVFAVVRGADGYEEKQLVVWR